MATLYRKYRSKTFDEVIGQEPIVTTLTNQVKLGRIGHAYLFTGSRGTGKTSCARIFARAVNCLHPVNGSPCGECEVCKKLDSPDNVDIIELDAASNNGVDDARDIREKVKYLPTSCKYKVYIIDEVHMLTGGAFNALLKTIEEPPEHVIFILATTEPQKLPQTILSRCIRFDFRLVDTDELAKHIARIYDSEGVKYTKDAVEEIARQGEGSVRDALSVADTLMSAADTIDIDVVLSLTGAGDSAAIGELFDAVAARSVAGALEKIDMFARRGKSMPALAHQLTEYARNVAVLKTAPDAAKRGLINADKATAERIAKSATFPLKDISALLETFSAAESGLKYSVNPRVYLETVLIKTMCAADITAELMRRVTALENLISVNSGEQKKNNLISGDSDEVAAARQADARYNAPTYETEPPPPPQEKEEISAPEPPPEQYTQRDIEEKPAPKQVMEKPAPKQDGQKQTAKISAADEGEFMQYSATRVSGMAVYGSIIKYLRKKGTYAATRARELLSRDGVTVKEREDAVVAVVPDDIFLSLSDESAAAEINGAAAALGIKKPFRAEKTAEDKYYDDMARLTELFGKDCVYSRGE